MTTNSMIIIRPSYEPATRYGSVWQTQILDAADNANLPYIDLYGAEATSDNFFSNLETQDPILVSIFGHGSYNSIVCQDNELLFNGGVNTNVLAERVVYDLSCQSGRDLGVTAVSEGAICFLGYSENFVFAYSGGEHPDGGMENPLEDPIAQGFFESHNAAPISYINGSTTSASYYASQDAFDYWIEVYEAIDSQVASFAVWNKYYQVMIPEVGPRQTLGAGLFPAVAMFAPLLFIPFLKKR